MNAVQLMPYLWFVIGVLLVFIVALILMLRRANLTIERAASALHLAKHIASRANRAGYSGSLR
jgi:hypothetical protein